MATQVIRTSECTFVDSKNNAKEGVKMRHRAKSHLDTLHIRPMATRLVVIFALPHGDRRDETELSLLSCDTGFVSIGFPHVNMLWVNLPVWAHVCGTVHASDPHVEKIRAWKVRRAHVICADDAFSLFLISLYRREQTVSLWLNPKSKYTHFSSYTRVRRSLDLPHTCHDKSKHLKNFKRRKVFIPKQTF